MAAIDRAIEPGGAIASIRKSLFRGSTLVNAVGMAVLVLLMLLIALDVILRYIFNSPIPGSLETCQYMLAILVAFRTCSTRRSNKGHVTVDGATFFKTASRRLELYIAIINSVFSLVLVVLITWRLAAYGHMFQAGNITSSVLKVPVYPFVSCGSLWFCHALSGSSL